MVSQTSLFLQFSCSFFSISFYFFILIFARCFVSRLVHSPWHIYRAILRRGLAFSASIKNPPLLKSRNIQSQSSITANVPITLIGSNQQSLNATSSQSIESTTSVQIKETPAQTKNTNLVWPQIQKPFTNWSLDLNSNSKPNAIATSKSNIWKQITKIKSNIQRQCKLRK